MNRRGIGFKKILNFYEFQEHYTEEMKPEFKSSNSEFCLIFKNLNYYKNIGNNLTAKNADKKMPIKTEHCMLLDVKERRAGQLLQELQEQKEVESCGLIELGDID